MSEKDGGPAFPQNDATVNRINNLDGMSLRDYFAGQAVYTQLLAGMLAFEAASDGRSKVTLHVSPEAMAANAYDVADAMLKAREQ